MNLEKSFRIALATKGMSKQDLAAEMKVTGAYITKVMTDRNMSVRTLKLVCAALNVKVWEFMKFGEE